MTTHETKCQPESDNAGNIIYILELRLLILDIELEENPLFPNLYCDIDLLFSVLTLTAILFKQGVAVVDLVLVSQHSY